MYKETINDTVGTFTRARKANASADYVIDGAWNFSMSDNLRTAGVNTPGFHKLKREGKLLPFTSFTQVSNKTEPADVNFEIKRLSDGWQSKHYGPVMNETDGDLVPWSSSGVGSDKIDSGPIMQRAASQTSGTWDVLTFAAEMGQTVGMFIGLLTKVTNLIRRRPPELPWKTWLEMRYGWRTLAFEMQSIEEAFSKATERKFSRASAGRSISWVETTTGTASLESVATQHLLRVSEYQMNSRGKIVVVGELPRFKVDIISTAWEVTRLSFVVDWFLNVGNWIDSVQFVIGERAYTAGFGSQVDITHRAHRTTVPNAGYVMLNDKGSISKEAIVQRRAPASIPILPLFSLNLDRWKIVDLLALLVQALWRK